ncbi:uncharacterized protein [Spinacia oleracea]|uniref:Uncharacterized protein n=1 Tax=Spinacia oleracea TaxID=3562 RepID=A0ABM3RRP3_SPIOL|nr:uncharacterized protein LOC110780578 [Spinacia oleracea]
MGDLRLLTLLESGLPSWVIFLQSYPVVGHVYRPWMCPLARALYTIISITTVVIGFYDLYKNVPLLKATASRLLGPVFDWIETWEMVSRVKYLGTMLFLHNFEKAVKWLLMITHTMRSFFSVLAQPIVEPLIEFSEFFLPFWTVCIQMSESFFSFICIVFGSSCMQFYWQCGGDNILTNLVDPDIYLDHCNLHHFANFLGLLGNLKCASSFHSLCLYPDI